MWKTATIGDVLSVIQNGINCTQDKSGKGLKITRIETIADANINFNKTGFSNLDDNQKQKAALNKGDILFSHINSPIHVGKTAIYDGSEPLYHGINLLRLRTIEDVDSKYFNFFLQSLFWSGYFRKTAKQSVNQASVNQTDIKKIPFAYPPLAEQKRIVAKLDAVFAAIDEAVEIARNKQKNAEQLFKNHLANIFQMNNQKWLSDNLKNLTSKIGSGATPKGGKASYKREGISLIRSMNVHDMYFKYKDLAKIDDKQASALSNVTVQENDILFNITGASVARCCLVEKDVLPARVNQHVSIIRADTSKVLPKFIVFGLISKTYKDQLLSVGNSGGATRQAITKTQIQDFIFHYPKSKEEQSNIINKLNSIYSHTKNIEEVCVKQINQIMQLKSAILSKELMPHKEFAA